MNKRSQKLGDPVSKWRGMQEEPIMSDKDWRPGNPVLDDIQVEDPVIKVKHLLRDYVRDVCFEHDRSVPSFRIRLVWFCYILGGWKALLSTDLKDDMYYEITYNAAKKETYLDAYNKIENRCYPDA